MSEQHSKLELLEQTLGRLKDLHHTYVSLAEKLAKSQAEATAAGLQTIADQLSKPFSSASDSAKLLESIVHDTEIERNKLRAESSAAA
jgi:hypothetical protein